MIKINNLAKSYDFEVLRDINLELPDRGFVALVGESGSGKSTLLKCMGLLEDVSSGDIVYNDENLTALSSAKKDKTRGRIFAYIPQATSLMEDDTVDSGLSFYSSDEAHRKAILEKLGIADKANELARNLSGGERQRVAIAQALLRETPVMLCDEITANLDPENAKQVYAILKDISKERLVVCVGHNLSTLKEYADRVIMLEDGIIKSDEIIADTKSCNQNAGKIGYAKETSIGVKKFLKIFSMGSKSKIVRIVFGVLFLFLAMAGLCVGITQPVAGSDGLIRQQAKLLGIDFVQIDEYQDDSYLAYNVTNLADWTIFVDFEKENKQFELVEGNFPQNDDEALITQYYAEFLGFKIGSTLPIALKGENHVKICGIIKSDLSAYHNVKNIRHEYIPYPSLTAIYCTEGKLKEYEDTLTLICNNEVANKNEMLCLYHNEEIIAGRQINDNAIDKEILVSTGYLHNNLGYDLQDIKSNPQAIFYQINKTVNLSGHNFTVVGICDNDNNYAYMKKGGILYLDGISGYVMPVDKIKKDNFKHTSSNNFINTALQNDTNLTKIGIPVFAVFALLSTIVLINLNVYEREEKKVLFRNMRQAGFSKQSLLAYNLIIDVIMLAIATILFLAVGLPIISHFQVVEREFDSMCLYAISGWAVVIAIAVMAVVTIVSYALTNKKFDKEICQCSKL